MSGAFSLIELVISMAILTIGLVTAMRVFPVGLRASHRAEMSSRAVMAGQRSLETLKLAPWDDLPQGEVTVQEDVFQITTVLSQPQVGALADPSRIKGVEIRVSWSQEGRARQIELVTYLRRRNG